MKKISGFFLAMLIFCSCKKDAVSNTPNNSGGQSNPPVASGNTTKPNIILLLVDDIGYEVPTYTGGQSYKTPTIDSLAHSGVQFSDMASCPNCSPSRQELMTGKYNNQNYGGWGIMKPGETTIGNILHDAGYMTCATGKWQLGGASSIRQFGFNNYLVFALTQTGQASDEKSENKRRYKNPMLWDDSGDSTSYTHGEYCDDLLAQFSLNFMDSAKAANKPFFIYHAFSLCHMPFSPTPDDPQYKNWDETQGTTNKTFFPSMVKYMDKKVSQICEGIKAKGLANNTIIIFVADNGTPPSIISQWNGNAIEGGKNSTTTYGTHVPFIVSGAINNVPLGANVSPGLVNFTDILATVADIAGAPKPSSTDTLPAHSFYSSLFSPTVTRTDTYLWFNPDNRSKGTKEFVRDQQYKKYDSTYSRHLFDIVADPLEKHYIKQPDQTPEQQKIGTNFLKIIGYQNQFSQ